MAAVPDAGQPRAGAHRLLVTTSYPRHADDPSGNFVAARVQGLLDAGETVHVLAAGNPESRTADRLTVTRIEFSLPELPPLFYGAGAPEALEQAPAAAALQALRFWTGLTHHLPLVLPDADILESHWLLPSTLAAAAASTRLPRPLPHVAHAHSGDVALLERLPGGAALARWLLRRLDTVVLASDDLRIRLLGLAISPPGHPVAPPLPDLRVEPAASPLLGAPPCRLTPLERAHRRAQGQLPRPVVLAIGRLVPIKGHDVLVRAVSRLAPSRRPTLVILGEGPLRQALVQLALARGVDLRLPGEVGPREVASWLALAELFVQPSRLLDNGRREGLPVALREAIAAHLPVIATATGGIPELAAAHREQVRLVPPGDPGAMAAALSGHLHGTGELPLTPISAGVSQVSSA